MAVNSVIPNDKTTRLNQYRINGKNHCTNIGRYSYENLNCVSFHAFIKPTDIDIYYIN